MRPFVKDRFSHFVVPPKSVIQSAWARLVIHNEYPLRKRHRIGRGRWKDAGATGRKADELT